MLMQESKAKKKKNSIWNFFRSVKLAITLLIILAIVSIVGTLIPQRESAMQFAGNLRPELFRLFNWLDLFDMYHSLWFRLLMAFITVNLVVCSLDRFPSAWKQFHAKPGLDRSKPFENLPPEQSLTVKEDIDESAQKVDRFLRARYKKIQKKKAENKHFFYAEKGAYSLFGVYLIHLSVLVILVGALVGSFFGFEARVNITEGERIDTVILRKEMTPMKLGFEVSCDKFTVEFYENGTPKEYRSELGFFVDGKKIEKKKLLVNHPVKFRGVMFYQNTYGTIPGKKIVLKILRHADEDKTTTIEVEQGNQYKLSGNEGQFQVLDVKGNFMEMGPAVLISVQPEKGEKIRFWVYQNREEINNRFPGLLDRFPKLNPSAFSPYTFSVNKMANSYYTGLQANKDPGVSIVWAGCFIMIAGFFVTFFTSHRRIRIRLLTKKQEVNISIAGTSNKDPVGLARELEHLTENLRRLFDKKGAIFQ